MWLLLRLLPQLTLFFIPGADANYSPFFALRVTIDWVTHRPRGPFTDVTVVHRGRRCEGRIRRDGIGGAVRTHRLENLTDSQYRSPPSCASACRGVGSGEVVHCGPPPQRNIEEGSWWADGRAGGRVPPDNQRRLTEIDILYIYIDSKIGVGGHHLSITPYLWQLKANDIEGSAGFRKFGNRRNTPLLKILVQFMKIWEPHSDVGKLAS